MRNWIRSKLWIYFSFLVLVITFVIAAIAIAVLSVLDYFEVLEFFNLYPGLRWILPIIFSSILGVTISIVVSKYILNPISKLQQALNKVIESDFSVQLKDKPIVYEVEELYRVFNLMVQELNSIEHLQNDFISIVSHEFKTPIAAIQGYAQLLQSPALSEDERNKYSRYVLNATRKLSTMTDNILKLSKLENQTISLEFSPFNLDEQIRQCIVEMQPQWEQKNITLTVDLASIYIRGNEILLGQVWSNLFENAIKYNQPGGQIIVSLEEKQNDVYITIEDTGVGISEEELPFLFDRFYQADGSRFSSGNGLGLSIVKRIIDLHKGDIHYESTFGSGTIVHIKLPKQ